jgi:hypothetical protein
VVLPHLKPSHLDRVYPSAIHQAPHRSRASSSFNNRNSPFLLNTRVKRRNCIEPCSQGICSDVVFSANSAYRDKAFYHHNSLVEDSHHHCDDLNNHHPNNHSHHNQRNQKVPRSKKASASSNSIILTNPADVME